MKTNLKKNLITLCLAGAWVLMSANVHAQKMKLESGTLSFLKGQQNLNVEFQYDGLTVTKFATEKDYIEKHMADLDKKEAGRGERWRASWYADRTNRYEPKFIELMNKILTDRKAGLSVTRGATCKYTLLVKTTLLDTGWNVGVMRRPAEVSLNAVFVDAQDHNKELAVVSIQKAPGRDAWGADFDTGGRLQEGYAKAGKELANFVYKQGLK